MVERLEPEALKHKPKSKTYTPTSPEEIWRRLPLEEKKYYYSQPTPVMPSAPARGMEQPAIGEAERVKKVKAKEAAAKEAEFGIIKESRELQATLIKEKPPSLAERLLGWKTEQPYLRFKPTGLITPPKVTFEPIRPLAGVAGVVAYPESLAYAGMTWVGKEPPTRPPPSPMAIEEPAYRLGYVTAMVSASYLASEAASKVFEKVVAPKAQAWLTKQYMEKGPAAWKGLPEKVVMKVTGVKPYMAPQVVSVSIAGEPPYTLPPTFGLKTGLVKYGVEEARAVAWALTETPKTTGLIISKMPEKLAGAWVKEHIYKTALGGLSYALVEEQLRKSIEPQMPYIPKGVHILKEPTFLPIFLPVIPRASVAPKFVEALKPKITPISPPKSGSIQAPATTQVPTIAQAPAIAQVPATSQVQTQQQVQRLVQRTIQAQPTPSPLKQMPVPRWLAPEPRKKRRRKKRGEDLFGLYGRYKRFYPVMPARKTLKKLLGV